MMLESLLVIAQRGIEEPLFLWKDFFSQQCKDLVPELKQIHQQLHDDTTVAQHVEILISVCEEEDPNEYRLAQGLKHLIGVFDFSPPEFATLIEAYRRDAQQFFRVAHERELHRQSREKLRSTLSIQEQFDHDRKLFQFDGMVYCLEYYLAMYRACVDTTDVKQKAQYMIADKVNLGSGLVPGLCADVFSEDALRTFIYRILTDDLRQQLEHDFFTLKRSLRELKQVSGDENADASVVDLVAEKLKCLIADMLAQSTALGLTHVSSTFSHPYGERPLISDIHL